MNTASQASKIKGPEGPRTRTPRATLCETALTPAIWAARTAGDA